MTEGQTGAEDLQWEVAKHYNLGCDVTLFTARVSATIDVSKDVRDNIFQARYLMPGEVGAVTAPYSTVGSMKRWGITTA